MLILVPLYSKPITAVATEMPRWRSISMKSDVAPFLILLLLTAPATWMAPPKSSSFSVRVVLPASGWAMTAKVRRRVISSCNVMYLFECFCRDPAQPVPATAVATASGRVCKPGPPQIPPGGEACRMRPEYPGNFKPLLFFRVVGVVVAADRLLDLAALFDYQVGHGEHVAQLA